VKSIIFENPVNHEQFVCDNIREVQTIDGIEYLEVHKKDSDRKFLFRKDVLKPVKSVNQK
jgi:hypothetical protein